MSVLILNHTKQVCGTYQFAKRVYELASRSTQVEYFYREVTNILDYKTVTNTIKPTHEIINYHWDRMPWLRDSHLSRNKHYFIYHDGSMMKTYDKYLFFGGYDLENKDALNRRALLPRPLFNYYGDYPINEITNIGSFGFNSGYKNFPNLVKRINEEFDNAVINLHLPNPFYGEEPQAKETINTCKNNITKSGISINITTNFLSDVDLLTFLAKNDINIFDYKQQLNPGLSSVFDYALSVKRPIAISDCKMFRHIRDENILLENNSIKDILKLGIKPLEKFYEMWSTENFIKEFDRLFT